MKKCDRARWLVSYQKTINNTQLKFGVILMAVPPMLLVLLALLDSPGKAGAALLIYLLIQQFEVALIGILLINNPSCPARFQFSYFNIIRLFLCCFLFICGATNYDVAQILIQEALIENVLDRWHSTS